MRLMLLSCEIFFREFCSCVARSPHTIDIAFLPKGLHDIGTEGMHERLQAALHQIDESSYDAILLGYGLCNNGIVGLQARQKPLVVPRAHDCITLFMGSPARYMEYFQNHPGVYFKTTGWIERGDAQGELSQLALGKSLGLAQSFEELAARYGEENARYLQEELGNLTKHYRQFTFIKMGMPQDESYEQQTRQEAVARGWKFEKVEGDLGLIERLVNGLWDEKEFLVVPPGHRVVPTYDERIIGTEQAAS